MVVSATMPVSIVAEHYPCEIFRELGTSRVLRFETVFASFALVLANDGERRVAPEVQRARAHTGAQDVEYEAIKLGFVALHRSVFDKELPGWF